jgi:hypothetical protein
MSRPQKIHKPIKGSFNSVLGAVAMGSGAGKRGGSEAVADHSEGITAEITEKA